MPDTWITFEEAASLVRETRGTSIGRAEALVRGARESGEVRRKQKRLPASAVYLAGDDGIVGFNQTPGAIKAMQSGILEEPPRFSRDDFIDWLDRHEPIARRAPAAESMPQASKAQIASIVTNYRQTLEGSPSMEGVAEFAKAAGLRGHRDNLRAEYQRQFPGQRPGRPAK